jgi:hypothetical protein
MIGGSGRHPRQLPSPTANSPDDRLRREAEDARRSGWDIGGEELALGGFVAEIGNQRRHDIERRRVGGNLGKGRGVRVCRPESSRPWRRVLTAKNAPETTVRVATVKCAALL